MQLSSCRTRGVVEDRRLTCPAVGTADLREAPAKLLQASADAILLGCVIIPSKQYDSVRMSLDLTNGLRAPGFIRFSRASSDWLAQIWHPFQGPSRWP